MRCRQTLDIISWHSYKKALIAIGEIKEDDAQALFKKWVSNIEDLPEGDWKLDIRKRGLRKWNASNDEEKAKERAERKRQRRETEEATAWVGRTTCLQKSYLLYKPPPCQEAPPKPCISYKISSSSTSPPLLLNQDERGCRRPLLVVVRYSVNVDQR
jgi:hypothetical protein